MKTCPVSDDVYSCVISVRRESESV